MKKYLDLFDKISDSYITNSILLNFIWLYSSVLLYLASPIILGYCIKPQLALLYSYLLYLLSKIFLSFILFIFIIIFKKKEGY